MMSADKVALFLLLLTANCLIVASWVTQIFQLMDK
jgi:hypothetical protein